MNPDFDLQERVTDELEWEPSVDASHVGVSETGGIVTLSGYVGSYFEKKKCEEIAKKVAGVRAVVDELDLNMPGMATRSDLEIAESAVYTLGQNVLVPPNRVQVTVDNGWITLDGEVEWQYQRHAAEDALKIMTGLRGITNKLRVRPAVKVGDIKSKIQNALVRSAQLDAKHIHIQINEDVVTLSGHVRSLAEKELAEVAVWSAPGITRINNNVVIAPN